MDAERFPITTPYGQVPGYELNNGWHRGEDRAMPMDTPVLVNGHEIGLSGNSGQVTGPHLHIGRFVGSQDTPPNGGGFHFSSAVVTEVSEDPVNGKFVRVQADGASWVYLHLSRQTVPVGQGLIPLVQAPTGPPYDIRPVDPYKRDVLEGHQKWNLDQPNFAAVAASPILTLNQRTTITVAAELHHHAIPQYTYLLEDPSVPQGYNQLDTEAYIPAPPPYTPPAAPVPFPAAEKYELVTDVPTYQTPTNAQNKRPADGERLPPDTYYVYANDSGMKELTLVNGKPSGLWINPLENKLPEANPPLPTPVAVPAIDPVPVTGTEANQAWKQYYRPHPTTGKYIAIHNYLVADIDGSKPTIELPAYQPPVFDKDGKVVQKAIGVVDVYGTFPGPDGTRYYRVKPKNDRPLSDAWYGIPILDKNGLPILRKEPTIKPATAAPVKQKASNKDTIHLITSHIEQGVPKFIDILPKWYKQINKQKGNK